MIRLLLVGLFGYTAYRVTMRIIEEASGELAPPDDRRSLRRQSAAMGVEPKR
ncbi:hypothetical protein P9228_26620 [Mesorhizobium sp. WSM4898]|uniref:hypothetical protein n=1 Tax=Mesorhizobium sp. WSM4898 TaxID=3038544 RepID=UPI0024153C41|nr:hypothetical protein [Mesorhizobium sp. WSM4898]MDG4909961.1 hypothetical protein [Mesorhizobium sp. WSM4898]